MNALRSEWGASGNLRFLVSSIGSFFANASSLGANVYNIFCVGMEAYACIEQDGYSASFRPLRNLEHHGRLFLLASLDDGLKQFHVVNVESAQGVFAFEGFTEQFFSMS